MYLPLTKVKETAQSVITIQTYMTNVEYLPGLVQCKDTRQILNSCRIQTGTWQTGTVYQSSPS